MIRLDRKLPIGIQTFKDIRTQSYLYVDKTDLVWQIANVGKPFFLSRPRRFGKSLLISTFEAYFEGKKDLFEGLAIERLENKWEKYPVLHLDLNARKYEQPEDLIAMLNQYLERWETVYGTEKRDREPEERFEYVIHRADVFGMLWESGKVDTIAKLFVAYIIEEKIETFGDRWMADMQIESIKQWEDKNTLDSELSSNYGSCLGFFIQNGFVYESDWTSYGNPRSYTLQPSLKKYLFECPDELIEELQRVKNEHDFLF